MECITNKEKNCKFFVTIQVLTKHGIKKGMKAAKDELEQLRQENGELRKALEAALETIKELKAQLNQTSRNSNWPSSRDKGKKRRTKSLRQKSKKAAGGQRGHEGKTLEFRADPDWIERHRASHCVHCAAELSAGLNAIAVEKRQVLDIPPLQLEVVEHQVETICCPGCGQPNRGKFPAAVTHPVQYGPRIKALSVYLKDEHFIPYERTQRLLCDLFRAHLSRGTLQNFTQSAAKRLAPVGQKLKVALQQSAVAHFDESGFYIGGARQWLHSVSTQQLTYYAAHRHRGRRATEAIGILPVFTGTAVHDSWATYWLYQACDHALCNVHHLRELNALIENGGQAWARRFKHFLLAAKAVVAAAKAAGQPALPLPKQQQVNRIYRRLVTQALAANPPPPDGWPTGKRGRVKKSKPRNLAERFDQRQTAILAFVYDFNVPFDNNLAERDIRMLKVQQKVSGCFRSSWGADAFCLVRSYISSLRKQNFAIWPALLSIFRGSLIEPLYSPG